MDFISALKEALEGKKIARLEWEGEAHIELDRDFLSKTVKGHWTGAYIVETSDAKATDWIVVN